MTTETRPDSSLSPTGRLVTLIAGTVLIAVQTIAASVAGGWAIAGFFGLGDIGAYVLEAIGLALGVYAVVCFVRSAIKQEPIRG